MRILWIVIYSGQPRQSIKHMNGTSNQIGSNYRNRSTESRLQMEFELFKVYLKPITIPLDCIPFRPHTNLFKTTASTYFRQHHNVFRQLKSQFSLHSIQLQVSTQINQWAIYKTDFFLCNRDLMSSTYNAHIKSNNRGDSYNKETKGN